MIARILESLSRIVLEPTMVNTLDVRFIRSQEVPAIVPNFHPGMVSTHVHPHRSARKPRRNANSAARVNQKNRQPCATRQPARHGLKRILVSLFARGRIANVDKFEQFLIQPLRRRARSFAIRNQRLTKRAKSGTPIIPNFIDATVRKNFVQENLPRNIRTATGRWKSASSARAMFLEKAKKLRGNRAQIRFRHILNQKLHFLARSMHEGLNEFRAIRPALPPGPRSPHPTTSAREAHRQPCSLKQSKPPRQASKKEAS